MDIAEAFRFSPVLREMMETGLTIGADGSTIQVLGGSTPNNLVVLRSLHMRTGAAATLEIGLAYGASALVFAETHHDLGHEPAGQHVAIDPFQNEHLMGAGLFAAERAGMRSYLTHREGFSDTELPALVAQGARFGIIYIDGSHLFEDVFLDAHYCAQLLEIGGVMLFDDSTDQHVVKVLRFLRSNMAGTLEPFDLSPYRADRGSSLKYRVGKALGRTQLTAFRKIADGRRPWDSKLAAF